MRLVDELEEEIAHVPTAVAANFLDSGTWKERLRRSLLYPDTQDTDDVLPLPISEYCVEKYREYAPSKPKKLGPRVASRLTRNACLSPSAVVTSMIYLQRLKESNPDYLKSVPSSDLFIVSMMVASKYLFDDGTDDECYNDDWANAVGFDLEALGKLEIEFLAALDWRCHVSNEQFSSFLKTFEMQIAMQQAQKTGMFTYNTTRNIDIMVAMQETVRMVSKVLFLSAFTLFGFTSLLNQFASKITSETDLQTDQWDLNFTAPGQRAPSEAQQQQQQQQSRDEQPITGLKELERVLDSEPIDPPNDTQNATQNATVNVTLTNPLVEMVSRITSVPFYSLEMNRLADHNPRPPSVII